LAFKHAIDGIEEIKDLKIDCGDVSKEGHRFDPYHHHHPHSVVVYRIGHSQ
jgi:hypothetical protein